MKRDKNTTSAAEHHHVAQDCVWATSEQTRLRALSLYLIRSIVEKYGGTTGIDLETDTIHIDVPKKNEIACAREIEEKIGRLCL